MSFSGGGADFGGATDAEPVVGVDFNSDDVDVESPAAGALLVDGPTCVVEAGSTMINGSSPPSSSLSSPISITDPGFDMEVVDASLLKLLETVAEELLAVGTGGAAVDKTSAVCCFLLEPIRLATVVNTALSFLVLPPVLVGEDGAGGGLLPLLPLF